MSSNIFDRLSFLSLFLVIVLLPVFCFPFSSIPVEVSKGMLLVLGTAGCLIFWAIARFSDGKVVFPKSYLLLSGLGIVLAFLLSALFSGNSSMSMFGAMLDLGSFWFIFSGFILMFLCSAILRTPEQAKTVLFGMTISSAFVLLFQSIHLFAPGITSLGILPGKTDNLLGSWNALGIFAGFSGIISLFLIEFFSISKVNKILLSILILLSLLMMAAVNFPLAWALFGVFALIIFVYKISVTYKNSGESGEEKENKNFPAISFFAVMVALLFFISSSFLGSLIPNSLKISNNEVSPSLSSTMSITKGVLSKDPVFGVGPNRFEQAWSMYKPASINNTPFWNTSFNSGFGLLPTITSTAGGLGILAWIVFTFLFLFAGVKVALMGVKKRMNWETIICFALALYLFISSFFYFTGSGIFLLSLAFAGIFLGLSASLSSKREVSLSFLNDPRKSFFSILFLVLLMIASVTASFKYMERFTSAVYFGKSVFASTIPVSEDYIGKALALYQNDLYWHTYSQINLAKLNLLVKKGNELTDAEKTDLQADLSNAIAGEQQAIMYNSKNYLNFLALGSVYQTALSLGIKDAYDQAIEAYKKAEILNPLNPVIKLSMAQASFAGGKTKEAKDYANTALSLKPDYVDALLVLSEIAKNEGDNKSALAYAEKALAIAPDNNDLIKYVDSLNNSAKSSAPASDSNPPKE